MLVIELLGSVGVRMLKGGKGVEGLIGRGGLGGLGEGG